MTAVAHGVGVHRLETGGFLTSPLEVGTVETHPPGRYEGVIVPPAPSAGPLISSTDIVAKSFIGRSDFYSAHTDSIALDTQLRHD